MGRVVRCACAVLFAMSLLVSVAAAESPFESPAHAVRELVSKRTPESRTWELPSGMRLTQVSAAPAQWQDAKGDWHDLDFSVSRWGAGWSARLAETAIQFPGTLDAGQDGVVRVASPSGDVLEMVPVGKPAAGMVADDVVRYADVAPGVDVELRVIPSGLKEDVVLASADASRDLAYQVRLSEGLELRESDDGGLVVERTGKAVFRIPAPVMVDSEDTVSKAGRYGIRQLDAGVWKVGVTLDEKWLDQKDRAWPVRVDPTVLPTYFSNTAVDDCQRTDALSGVDGAICNSGASWRVGNAYHGGSMKWRYLKYLRFATIAAGQGDAIQSATLTLRPLPSSPGLEQAWRAFLVTEPWDLSVLSVGLPDYARAATGTFSGSFGGGSPLTVDVTNAVAQWRDYVVSNGARGIQNNGLMIGDLRPECGPPQYLGTCESHLDVYTSSASNGTNRPLLEVYSYPGAPSGSAVISPGEGDLTAKRVPLQARALATSVTTTRFQYIAGSQRSWTDIPLSALSTPTGGSVGSQDIAVSGPAGDRRSDLVVWDLSATPGGDVDGPVHVRAWLDSTVPGDKGMTEEINFRLDRRGIDGAATEPIGPGELNLLSGEFSMTQTDVSIKAFLQDLQLSRTYRSRGVADRNADMFGPSWDAGINPDGGDLPYKGIYDYTEVRDAAVDRDVNDPANWNWELFFQTGNVSDLEPLQTIQRFAYEYAVVEAVDGEKMTFTAVDGSGGRDWTADDTHPGFVLKRDTTGTAGVFQFTLTDPDGNVATFLSEAADSPNARMSSFKQPGSPGALSYTYEAAGTRQRLKTVTAPQPPSGAARSLTFNWSNVGTPAVSRVTSVNFTDGNGTNVTVASYAYDTNGRLIQWTDPRAAGGVRTVRYHYDATSGLLDQVTPPGEATWNLAYTSVAGDAGSRLASVSRAHPDGGTATNTVMYNVPLSGAGAPYDLSAATTATWAQTSDLPWDAVAIWPGDTVPDLRAPDYRKATVYYVDLKGMEVNVAQPGGAISTMSHDARGNTISTLSPLGRSVALAAGAGRSAAVAIDRSSYFTYLNDNLIASREPVTQVTKADGSVVTGRRITKTNYDENNDGTQPASGGPWRVVTSVWQAIEVGSTQYDDHEELRNYYAGNGGMLGWTARQATRTTVDPRGRAIDSYRVLHPTYPIVEETRAPGSGTSNDPRQQWYQYYGITPGRVPSGIAASGCSTTTGAAYPAGFLCLRSEGTLPDSQVVRRWFDYGPLGLVTAKREPRPLSRAGTGVRVTSAGYTSTGEMSTKSVTGGTGTAVPDITYTNDLATGRQIAASSSNGTIRRVFDSNGRVSSYTDAAGTVTTYRYDLRGRNTSKTVDGVTTTYGYDDRDNLTSVTDPAVGTAITASYDLDDNLASETLPNGLVATEFYDETTRPSRLEWTKTSGCSSNCTWARSEVLNRDADGRILVQRTNTTRETLAYDTVGRLVTDDAVRLSDNSCVRKTYTYDGGGSGASNRTSTTTWTSRAGGACGTGTSSTGNLSYDSADRISASGWIWDYFGRATNVPATDSGGTGALTAGYYVNDHVRQLTLDSRTQTYTRDTLDRTKTVVPSGGGKPTYTETYRYSDDTDEPEKITISTGSVSHDVEGPSGQIVATKVDSTLTYDLRDIQGNIVGIAPTSGTPAAATEYDPFGIVTTAGTNVIDWTYGDPGYGWLGAHQRTTDFGQTFAGAGGPIEMGARVYLPKVGRFLQVDPIDGGSANAYDYAFQDPTDIQDLSGNVAGIGAAIGQGIKNIFKKKGEEVSTDIVDGVHFVVRRCTKNTFLGATFALGDALRNNWDDVTKLLSRVSNKAGRRAAAKTLAKVIADIPGSGLIGFTGGCLVG